MILTIEEIVEGLLDGKLAKWQAINWLHVHADNAGRELRDDFAMYALSGLVGHPDLKHSKVSNAWNADHCAKAAYEIADAMFVWRQVGPNDRSVQLSLPSTTTINPDG